MTAPTVETPRPTSTSNVSRTKAATAARQRLASERAAMRLGLEQLDHLPDSYLLALIGALIGEAGRRGLEVPDDGCSIC